MEKSFRMKASFLAVSALAAVLGLTGTDGFRPASENEITRNVKDRMNKFVHERTEERVYLRTDKPLYEPGDAVWMSVAVVDGVSLKPSAVSDIAHIEVVGPAGNVMKNMSVIVKKGVAACDFQLDENAVGGLYKVRAYTRWMKNEGEETAFTREFTVQDVQLPKLRMKLDFVRKAYGKGDKVMANLEVVGNDNQPLKNKNIRFYTQLGGVKGQEKVTKTDATGNACIQFQLPGDLKTEDGLLNVMIDTEESVESISRSIPLLLNNVQLTFFPEGGEWVEGLPGVVAFRALNSVGKPADVEGVIVNGNGVTVASFSSFHNGMGQTELVPVPGQVYYARITKPAGIEEQYRLPAPLKAGYVMNVNALQAGKVSLNIHATQNDIVSLVAQVRGQVYYTTVLMLTNNAADVVFSTKDFPAGVAQITLFDGHGIPRCERLAFVNADREMKLTIETDKDKYVPREKVRLTVSASDDKGFPVQGHISLAVVNDQLLTFADDKSGNLVSQLLLQQDIREKVEEPSYYFRNKSNVTAKALDQLLMTAGWRRFSWEKLWDEALAPYMIKPEQAIVAGRVLDNYNGHALAGATIIVPGRVCKTDSKGAFSIRGLDLTSPVMATVQVTGFPDSYTEINAYNDMMVIYAGHQIVYEEFERVPMMADRMMEKAAMGSRVQMDVDLAPVQNFAIAKKHAPRPMAMPVAAAQPKVNVNKEGAKMKWARNHQLDTMEPMGEGAYYRARVFASPSYDQKQNSSTRTDFRQTVYWNPDVELGFNGRKTIEFYLSDDVTPFKAMAEGISVNGQPGAAEKVFYTQLPFSVSATWPELLVDQDRITVPVTFRNNTKEPLAGIFSIATPSMLTLLTPFDSIQTVMPNTVRTVSLTYAVKGFGKGDVVTSMISCGFSDAFSSPVKVDPRGFPAQLSFSSDELDKTFKVSVRNRVPGSLRVSVTAFPNVVTDLVKGIDGILQEPYGCFEQTSCTAYPNAMVLDYLQTSGSNDPRVMARATDLLDRGYKRLTTFETPAKGYEWFGANPAHEGLTAYGIMEFADMKRVGQKIDQDMLDRTANWLLSRKNGRGGFEREKRALHDFGRISEDVMNGYIVYALASAGYRNIDLEYKTVYAKAKASADPYLMALSANAAFLLGRNDEGNIMMELLLNKQDKDGGFMGTTHSITYSQGSSLNIETTALAAMAMLRQSQKDNRALTAAIRHLVSCRSGSGAFNSTQGTILALKCLTEFAKYSKRTAGSGTLLVEVDGRKAGVHQYKTGEEGDMVIEGLEQYFKEDGNHTIRVKFTDTRESLPYSVSLAYRTTLPESSDSCRVRVAAAYSESKVKMGETVRMNITISNVSTREIPSTIAIIGIPAGLALQPWQLKELQDKFSFDYYEIKGSFLSIYYRGMAPFEQRNISLDLRTTHEGNFESPASTAYLYYNNEYKNWINPGAVEIKK